MRVSEDDAARQILDRLVPGAFSSKPPRIVYGCHDLRKLTVGERAAHLQVLTDDGWELVTVDQGIAYLRRSLET